MKKLISLFLILFIGITITACGGNDGGGEKLKAALLTGGPVNDGGWNETAYNGLLLLQDMGYEIGNTENVTQEGQKQAIQAYCDQGYNLVIGHGYEWGDALKEMADKYPDVTFLQIGGGAGGTQPNFTSAEFKAYELGYVCGKIGAELTESKKFGFVGASKIPTLIAEVDGIKAAINETDPSIEVIDVYTGSWTDIAAGKKAAEQLINQGVDAILGIGDACDAGVIQAIQEAQGAGKDVKFIGWTGDFYEAYQEDFIITSGIQDVAGIIEIIGQEVMDDEFEARYWIADVNDGLLRLGEWSPEASDEAKKAGADAIEEVKAGNVTAESIYEMISDPGSEFYAQEGFTFEK